MSFSAPKRSPRILFIVYTQDPDCATDFEWQSAWPTKKQAMATASKYSVGRAIVYLKDLADSYIYDPATHIVVCAQSSLVNPGN